MKGGRLIKKSLRLPVLSVLSNPASSHTKILHMPIKTAVHRRSWHQGPFVRTISKFTSLNYNSYQVRIDRRQHRRRICYPPRPTCPRWSCRLAAAERRRSPLHPPRQCRPGSRIGLQSETKQTNIYDAQQKMTPMLLKRANELFRSVFQVFKWNGKGKKPLY